MLSAVEAEVSRQPDALSSFLTKRVEMARPGSLFVGAGDSYAASSIAACLSSLKHHALDPYELASAPELAKGRTVYFVSASGRTVSNLAAAKAVKGLARETVAVTANPQGKLLATTDRAIMVPYKYVPRTPGTLSFSMLLLALLKLAAGAFRCDFRIQSRAKKDAKRLLFSGRGVTYFLGNGAAFPVSLYSALKIYEVLGWRSQAAMLEGFNHAALFALRKEDAVNAFGAFDPMDLGRKLAGALNKSGFRAAAIPTSGANPFEQTFYCIFLAQLAILGRATSEGLSKPHFVGASRSLAVSDSLIY